MDLKVTIQGDSRGATTAIRQTAGAVEGLGSALSAQVPMVGRLSDSMATLATPAGVAAAGIGLVVSAAAAVGTALYSAISATVEYGDRIGDTAAQLGIGTDALQSLSYATERAGGDADSLRGAVKALTGNIVEAADPASKAARIFDALGVATTDAAGAMRPVEDVLRDTIGALGDLGPGTEQAAAAGQLLGRSYQQLLPLISQGSEGLADLEQRARDLGGVMGGEAVQAASDFDDALIDLRLAGDGVVHMIGSQFTPAISAAAKELADFAADPIAVSTALATMGATMETIGNTIAPAFGTAIRAAASGLWEWIGGVGRADAAVQSMDNRFAESAETFGSVPAALTAALAGTEKTTKAANDSAVAAARARIEWEHWMDSMGDAAALDIGATVAGWDSAADAQASAMARRNAEFASFAESGGGPDAGIDLAGVADLDAANDSQARLADSTRDTAAAFGQATTAAGDLFGTIIDGANTSGDKTLALTGQLVRLGTQVVAQIATSAAAAISASASTATAQTASNTAIATSAGVAGGAQATATYGASAGAGAAAFIGALASIGGAVASFVAGIADGGVGPEDMRRAGLLRHTTLAIRNDERVLSPTSSRYVDEMMEAYRSEGRVGGQRQSVRIDSPILLDGREIGRFVDEHLITSEERGRSYRDQIREPLRRSA